MFARIYTAFLIALSLSLLAVATPWGVPTVTVTETAPAPTVTTVSECNTGPIQCCDQVLDVSLELYPPIRIADTTIFLSPRLA